MIVKVERPTAPTSHFLAYDEGRQRVRAVDHADVAIVLAALGARLAGHFEATWMGGSWFIAGRVPDQGW